MSKYLPYSGQHSIQEAKIALHFLRESGQQDVERAQGAAETDLRDELPRSSEFREIAGTFDVTRQDAPVPIPYGPMQLTGFEISKVKGDGRPARALRLVNNLLEVSVSDYERWEITRDDSLRYFQTALSVLPLDSNPVMAVNLQFIDRYTFNGPPHDVDVSLLFRDGSDYIARHCYASGPLWHCHTGWFESSDGDGGRVLHHLNIGSNIVDLSPAATVDHNVVFQFGVPRQSMGTLFEPPNETDGISDILDRLHERNKTILRELLTQEMQSEIGL